MASISDMDMAPPTAKDIAVGAVFAGSPSDYFALLKPRVMSLVCFTAMVGTVLSPGSVHPVLAVTALLCIAVGAGAAGAINMWFDSDIDGLMARTRGRPIPAGRIEPGAALGFGVSLAVGSVILMGLALNLLAAGLLAFTILFYALVYTAWLKRRTPQNIVIGGAAGALPPVVGWAAVSGELSLLPLLLFAIIFLWTPPHFWALALYRRDDYERVGVPMLPVVSGDRVTRRQILFYSVGLVLASISPVVLGLAGWVHGVGAGVLGALFLWHAVRVWRGTGEAEARTLFGVSILYLFLLFVLLLADHAVMLAGWLGR